MPRKSALHRFINVTLRRNIIPFLDNLKGPYQSRADVIERLVLKEYKKEFEIEKVTYKSSFPIKKILKKATFALQTNKKSAKPLRKSTFNLQ